jgi:hypothetical protein
MILAFTQGDIDMDIYLIPPENPDYNNILLLLNKVLYRLKQSVRIWYFTLKEILIKLGFKSLITKEYIFINKDKNIILYIYIDNIAIISPDENNIKEFINNIKSYLDLKDLGPIKDYLGIQIDRTQNSFKLHQKDYIIKILTKFKMLESKPVSTPMDPKLKLITSNKKASKSDIK